VIKIIDDFLCDDNILEELYRFFHYAGSWQFDFFTNKYVWSPKHKDKTENYICKIIRTLPTIDPAFNSNGYEVWANCLGSEMNHLNHHVDCDEGTDDIETAKKTAVIFLGGDDDLEGGELVMDTNQYHSGYKFETNIYKLKERSEDEEWLKIPYKPNRLVIFEGNMAHGVLPIKHIQQGTSRVSLMISCWDKTIEVVR
tara:strand:- start:671 stop:1264 length:594 start_codon:yes stop_codon:yes gene_type:complete